jgi:ketosteroid isomerase-like protein
VSENSATPSPVEIARRQWDALSRGEFDEERWKDWSSDAVFDTAGYGMGTFEGLDAIRSFNDEWRASFEDLTMVADEIVGFGSAVVLTVYHQNGRPLGGGTYVRVRSAWVGEWVDGKIARVTIYTEADIDQARADAERLADAWG